MIKSIILGGLLAATAAVVAVPAAAQEYDLCGNKANVALTPPGANANSALKQYFGVWNNGQWSTGICNALVVSAIDGDKATVTYYYGTGPGVPTPGSFVKTDATLKGKYLAFKSAKGADVSYELSGGELKGWFGSTELSKKLRKVQ